MECVHIPIVGYGALSKRLHQHAVEQRIPLNVSIEVTSRCNLRCVHCYIKDTCSEQQQGHELRTEQWYNVLDQVADAGCLWLLMTGGEPLLRRDFMDLYLYAKRKGLFIGLNSNGTLITEEIADMLAEWPPFVVEITLYGHTEKVYESITGVPGSYRRCREAVEMLIERKVPLRLKTTVLNLNKDELQEIRAFAEDLGVQYRYDAILNSKINGDSKPLNYRLTPEQVVLLDETDEKRKHQLQELFDRYKDRRYVQPEYMYQCGAGVTSCHIDFFGHLCICLMSRQPNYNVLNGSFSQGWNSVIRSARETKWEADVACRKCELQILCNQCPGWSLAESGDPQTPVDFLCRVAHLRAKSLSVIESKNEIKN